MAGEETRVGEVVQQEPREAEVLFGKVMSKLHSIRYGGKLSIDRCRYTGTSTGPGHPSTNTTWWRSDERVADTNEPVTYVRQHVDPHSDADWSIALTSRPNPNGRPLQDAYSVAGARIIMEQRELGDAGGFIESILGIYTVYDAMKAEADIGRLQALEAALPEQREF